MFDLVMRFKCRHIVSFWCSRIVATTVGFSSLGAQPLGSVLARQPHLPHFYAIVARWALSGLRQVLHLIINPLLSDKNLHADKPFNFHTLYLLKGAKDSSCAMGMKGKLRV